ncbi:cyclase family protein [Clostridium sp. NSJ-49]|uniref:cyclase family protein n=1 Tax=Clostridium TaxID=1485 RepID=UPI00164B1C2A|nr:cyclase family protein [Clostridium sp. NSJ-49]MBC5626225.1 cyclase family protein [Clostridium sp. NSJ-49]MDU6341381.1 cyclase family protein [Clostridium sp.]
MKFLDLSYEIDNGMPVYPGDEEVNLEKISDLNKDGYESITYSGTMHAGTHIDAPMHMIESDKYICDYPLDNFIGKGVLLDVRGQQEINLKDEYFKLIKENHIVLFYTGFDKKYGQKEYYENHPIITKEMAEFLVRKKVKMVGVDMPSPDRSPYEVHSIFLNNNIFILENLTNLEKLIYEENFSVFAQPLKIKAEGSLVRAIAVFQGY